MSALPVTTQTLRGGCPQDCPDTCAMLYTVEDGKLTAAAQKQDQRKYEDPNGIKFDIANGEHARNSWRLPV